MEIITKYNIGDNVYFMSDNKVKLENVVGINISVDYKGRVLVYYSIERMNAGYSENKLFKTQEELLKTIGI